MDDVSYREARSEDVDTLVELSLSLAKETEGRVLDQATVRTGLEQLMGVEGRNVFVAEVETAGGKKQVIGFLSVSGKEWSEWKNGLFVWLGSAYVSKNFRGQDVVQRLYKEAVTYSKQSLGAIGVRTYVRLDNTVSIGAHVKGGLKSTGYVLMQAVF